MASLFTHVIRTQVTKLTQNSQEVGPGTVFFAIEGSKSDGHDFVKQALANGAVAVVIRYGHRKESELRAADSRVIGVENPRRVLGEAASEFYGYPSNRMIVCGVTGTNGKTTSTYLLEAILEGWGQYPAVIGTVENRLGKTVIEASHTTPDAVNLQRLLGEFLDQGATAIAMEVSSHALDQWRTAGIQFAAAIFTNLTQDHLDYHGTLENYFAAKAKLFTEYPVKVRAIHGDDEYGKRLIKLCEEKGFKVITFGKSGWDINYEHLKISAAGIQGDLDVFGQPLAIHSPLLGAFNAQNISGVVAAAAGLGVQLAVISAALENAKQVPGRMEKIPNQKGLTVVVDYAHTPDALENALKTLRPLCQKRLLCVFGCGGDRDPDKRAVMGAIAERLAHEVYVTSDNPRTEDADTIIKAVLKGFKRPEKAHVISDRRQAIAKAISQTKHGDILLIAGKGHENYQIIGTEKLPFDDRKVALENL